MTDQALTEENKPKLRANRWAKIGVFFSTFAVILFICAFGYGYFQLSKVNIALAQSVERLQHKNNSNEKELNSLHQSILTLQQAAQKSQVLSDEQEKLVSEWRAAQKGNLEKWQVAEAQYMVRLANDHLQFTYHFPMAIVLLQRADRILQNLQDPSLLEIRKAITLEISQLQALPQVDTTALYSRLNGLNQSLDQLPLMPTPLKPDKVEPISENLSWWKTGMAYSWQTLKKIVIVRNTNSNALPLVLPDEKIFLYQNLHAQMESVMWGALHRNAEIYQTSLARLKAWIQLYFDQNAEVTKKMIDTVDELQKMNIQPPAVNLVTSLQLFDTYFAQANAAG